MIISEELQKVSKIPTFFPERTLPSPRMVFWPKLKIGDFPVISLRTAPTPSITNLHATAFLLSPKHKPVDPTYTPERSGAKTIFDSYVNKRKAQKQGEIHNQTERRVFCYSNFMHLQRKFLWMSWVFVHFFRF